MRSFLKRKKDGKDKRDDPGATSLSTSSASAEAPVKTTSTTPGPEFAIQRIYVKSLNFVGPSTPDIFQQEWKPVIDMQIQANTSKLKEGLHEAIIKVTVTGKSNNATLFTVEVEQAGIFVINRFSTDDLGAILGGMCPNILFPYARETITDMATRGTFPAIYLAPINFDVVYAQMMQKQKQAKEKQ